MNIGQYVEKYRIIRRGSTELILLEGIHAFKHAFRFGAEFEEILIGDEKLILSLQENVLQENEKKFLLKNALKVNSIFFDNLLPYQIRSKIVALAKKPKYNFKNLEQELTNKPLIFLENPANPENIGMIMRVVAAWQKNNLNIGALIVSGNINPFSSSVLRAGDGLCFSLPIFYIQNIAEFTKNRKIISLDPTGKNLFKTIIPKNSLIIFGTERNGISKKFKEKSELILKLEMRKNVSSLNLATSVSAFLYGANFE